MNKILIINILSSSINNSNNSDNDSRTSETLLVSVHESLQEARESSDPLIPSEFYIDYN